MSHAIPILARPMPTGLFDRLEPQPADTLLGLIGLYNADPRPSKIDLGVGVYRDDAGHTPILRAVKDAERRLLRDQTSKAYLGPEGDARFVELLQPVVFGSHATPCLTGVQTPGGTGALRLGAELIARSRPDARVWIGQPTWPNHKPIFERAGLATRMIPFFDTATQTIEFEEMCGALMQGRADDIVLLHGCSHNPSGAEFDAAQWSYLADLIAARGMIPFIDLAYQGLGRGFEADAAGMRLCLKKMPEALVAYSCDKNFGLYRERVGALWIRAATVETSATVRENMLVLARSIWSMPPDHGAALVRIILDDPELTADWRLELDAMRHRIGRLRGQLAAMHPHLAPIARQTGMFSLMPIDRNAVARLRADHGIYMADTGRINIAGLRLDTIPHFVESLDQYL